MIKNLFNEKKAAQAAAYFLFRAGEPISVLKLMKLLYLAERRSFERYCAPMIGDRIVSMPHGLVLSITYNHMSGELESVPGGWDSWIADRVEHNLDLRDRAALKSPEDDHLYIVLNDPCRFEGYGSRLVCLIRHTPSENSSDSNSECGLSSELVKI